MGLLTIVYFCLLFIISIIGMVRFKRLTIPFKILALSVIANLLMEVLSEIFIAKYHSNALVMHIECAIGYVFYASIYFYLLKSRILKKLTIISIALVLILSVLNALLFQQPSQVVFPTHMYLINNILYVIFSLVLFKQMLQYPLDVNIIKQSIFWFNTAMIFFSTTMFLNMELTNYYAQHKWGYDVIYYFWNGNFYLFNILICISLLNDNRERSVHHK
jgi:hypothetical protein